MPKSKEHSKTTLAKAMECLIKGTLISCLFCVVLLFAASLGISLGMIGEGSEYRLTVFACIVATLAGGWYASRKLNGLWPGAVVGAAFGLCLLMIGVLLYEAKPLENGGIGIVGASVIGGALSGVIGGRKRSKRHR